MRRRRFRFPISKGYRFLIALGVFLMAVFYILYKVDRDFKPIIMALCDAEARIIATGTINETIRDEFSNKIAYDNIMSIKTDKDGNIVMLQANTVELNRLGSQIALGIQNRIAKIGGRGVKMPVGIMLKNDLLAYYGPKITFKMKPMGSTTASYSSDFKAAGINQTRHILYLNVTATVQVMIPLARNSVTVTSSIPVAESIIVGKVPGTYAEMKGGMDSSGIMMYENRKSLDSASKTQ